MLKKISLLVFLSIPLMILADHHVTKEGKSPKEMKKMEIELKKLNRNFDKRKLIEVVKDERLKGNNIYPYVVPREFLKKKVQQCSTVVL